MSKKKVLFRVGDIVTWMSQAGGFWKVKTGVVTRVIPAGVIVADGFSYNGRRKHESYLVEVTPLGKKGQKLKPQTYWPVVSQLRRATKKERKAAGYGEPALPLDIELAEEFEEIQRMRGVL